MHEDPDPSQISLVPEPSYPRTVGPSPQILTFQSIPQAGPGGSRTRENISFTPYFKKPKGRQAINVMVWFLGHNKMASHQMNCIQKKKGHEGKWVPVAGAGSFLSPGHLSIIFRFVLRVAIICSPKSIKNFQGTKTRICGSGLDPDFVGS